MNVPLHLALEIAVELLVGGGGVLWFLAKLKRVTDLAEPLARLLDVSKDFPPHRHINGNISYPQDYQPAKVGHLEI